MFLRQNYENFITTFSSTIESLTEKAEGKSPIMETFVRISNSESFQSHSDKPHNMFIVSDMLQHSDNYSHYKTSEGPSWDVFEEKMKNTYIPELDLIMSKYKFFGQQDSRKEIRSYKQKTCKFLGTIFLRQMQICLPGY